MILETLGGKTTKNVGKETIRIFDDGENLFALKRMVKYDLYYIVNRVTGKTISEYSYPRAKALAFLERLK